MADGEPRRIVYGEGGPADIQLACGSRINLMLERIAPGDDAALRLLDFTATRQPATWLSDGRVRACLAVGEDPAALPSPLGAAAQAAASGGCGHAPEPFFAVFRAYTPPLRLIVLGGDPIALAVVRLAADMGVETVLIRPKGPPAAPFASLLYLRTSLAEALQDAPADPWTAIAILTHDADQEHAALKAALDSRAGYVGALGSRRRIPERNARLEAAGLSPEAMARVRAPIGLPIGGKSPWEIAVSIIAEIVADTPPKGATAPRTER
jgi:xanthine dehydrogenase accessory factor